MTLTRLTLIFGLIWLTSCDNQPTKLSGKTETIEVSYINWACDCADFIETKFYAGNSEYEAKEEDCIFIEPANPNIKIPENYFEKGHFENHLKLTGQFYIDKGVPNTYERKTPEAPEKAKVFRYVKFELVKKETQTKLDKSIDQIIFGVYCGECGNHCATMYRYSMTGNQNSFSVDLTDSYFKNKSEIIFNTYLNDQFHFNIGQEIVSNIPDSLLAFNKSSERFGCPDCTDGCGIYFEITKENKKYKYYIDNQTSQLTGDIKIFAEFLKTKITQLDKKNGL